MADQERNLPTAPPPPPQSSAESADKASMPPVNDTMPRLDYAKYATINKTATLNSNASYEFNPDKSFWSIGGYKAVLTRCEDGHELGNRLVDMLTDRAKIEDTYAKSLIQWKKKWVDHLNSESTEYASGRLLFPN
jgi:hypothetical protein